MAIILITKMEKFFKGHKYSKISITRNKKYG